MDKSRFVVFLTSVYALGIFVTSDRSLRFMSMTLCNFIAVGMGVYLFLKWRGGRVKVLSGIPMAIPLGMAIVWAGVSLFLSYFKSNTAIPPEAYFYAWATGVNSPGLRGISFLVRLGIAISAFYFIYRAVSDSSVYSRVLRIFSWGYVLFCTIVLAQIGAYHAFGYSFGQVFFDPNGQVRVGSYVGEPSVMAAILVSGYFLFVPFFKMPSTWPKLPLPVRWYTFVAATLGLIYAMSASIIAAIALAYLFTGLKRRHVIILSGFIALSVLFIPIVVGSLLNNPVVSKIQTELTTVNIRSLSWIIGFEMFRAAPITGVGIGRTPFFNDMHMPTYVDIGFDLGESFDYTAVRHTAMNTYIEWLAETGIIGAGILLWVLLAGYRSQKAYSGESTAIVRKTFGMALVTLLIAANSFPGAFYLSHLIFVAAMYFGGLSAYDLEGRRKNLSTVN